MHTRISAIAIALLSVALFAIGAVFEAARAAGLVTSALPHPWVIPTLGLISMLAVLRWLWLAMREKPASASDRMLIHYAYHDALTKLPNRLLLRDRMALLQASMRRAGGYIAVHIIDLDGFKRANDTFGHRAGDALLIEVADRLRTACRETDTVARLGGDEFVVLQPIEEEAQAAILGNRIIEAIAQPFPLLEGRVLIGSSIGVVVTGDPDRALEDLLDEADLALYRSKNQGGNLLTFHRQEAVQSSVNQSSAQQSFRQHGGSRRAIPLMARELASSLYD